MKYLLHFSILLIIILYPNISSKKTLKIGDMLPDFTLVSNHGKSFTSSDYYGKQPMVIFFYPKDNAPICTAEVCSFRDRFQDFKALNVKIVGISTENIISHRRFVNKHQLPYILLSDHSKRIQKLFGITRGFLNLKP